MENRKKEDADDKNNKTSTGDPGRTATKAEGDRDTVEQDISDKEQKGQI
jgi:hypothetical protein